MDSTSYWIYWGLENYPRESLLPRIPWNDSEGDGKLGRHEKIHQQIRPAFIVDGEVGRQIRSVHTDLGKLESAVGFFVPCDRQDASASCGTGQMVPLKKKCIKVSSASLRRRTSRF